MPPAQVTVGRNPSVTARCRSIPDRSGPCSELLHRKLLQYQAVPSGCQSSSALPSAGFAGNSIIIQDPESTSTIRLRDSGSWLHRKSHVALGRCFKQSHNLLPFRLHSRLGGKEVSAAQPNGDRSCNPKRKAGSCIPALLEISIRPSLIVNPCSARRAGMSPL